MQMSSGKLFPSFNKERVESKIISFNKIILKFFLTENVLVLVKIVSNSVEYIKPNQRINYLIQLPFPFSWYML